MPKHLSFADRPALEYVPLRDDDGRVWMVPNGYDVYGEDELAVEDYDEEQRWQILLYMAVPDDEKEEDPEDSGLSLAPVSPVEEMPYSTVEWTLDDLYQACMRRGGGGWARYDKLKAKLARIEAVRSLGMAGAIPVGEIFRLTFRYGPEGPRCDTLTGREAV
jgi:hypothetical protein